MSGLKHALVVGELEQVVFALAGRRAGVGLRRLPARMLQRRTKCRRAAGTSIQAAVVLDIRRPVSGAAGQAGAPARASALIRAGAPGRSHQQVGFAHPPPGQVRGQAPTHDELRPGPNRGERRRLPRGPVPPGNQVRVWVDGHQPGDYLRLELPAARQPPLDQP